MPGDVVCVRRVGTVEQADIIVAWLAEQGVEATVTDRGNPGALAFGLTDAEGFALCVADQETAQRARDLLDKHDAEHAHEPTGDLVDVKCGECGETPTFESESEPSVQTCPDCGANIDVPAAED